MTEIKNEKGDLTTGTIWKKLISFFVPIFLGMLFQQLYNTADAIIVGHYEGSAALAAVGGSAAVITNLIIGFFVGMSSGATVIIAQEFGAGDREKLSETMHTAFTFALLVGAAITVIGILSAGFLLRLVRNPEDIMKDSVLYLRIYYLGAVPLLIYNLGAGILQAVGDSRRPFIYLIISTVTNIALDLLFVGALGLGVAGVAAASVMAMLLCSGLLTMSLLRTEGMHRLELRKLAIRKRTLSRILHIGVPAGVQSSMYSISNIIIQVGVNSFGTDFVAAWTATGKLDGFYWVTINAFGVAICAFVGQCFGAGKTDRMKSAVKQAMAIAMSVTVGMIVLLLSIARPAYSLFIDSGVVIDFAVQIMWYFVPFYFVWTLIEILSGALRGVGDTVVPMFIIIIGTCGVRILWMAFVVPIWHTMMAVSIIYPITWAITATAFLVYYLKGSWLKKRLAERKA